MVGVSSQKGFTLLEVLLAISILAISVTVIMQQLSGGLQIARLSRNYTTATIYAKQKLEELQTEEEIGEMEERGDFEDGYFWYVSITPYEDHLVEEDQDLYEYLPLEIYRLESVVGWREGEKEKRVSLATLRAVKKEEGL